jgi:hypothetical protein
MPELPTISDLDPDGLADYLAEQEYLTEPNGSPVFGSEFLDAHFQYCTGCTRCWRIVGKPENN